MSRPLASRLLVVALAIACTACAGSGHSAPPSDHLQPAHRGPQPSAPAPEPARPAVAAQPRPTAPSRGDALGLPTIGDDARYESVVVKVEGMTCAFACPKEVRYQLEAVPGVVSCSVDFTSKTASCRVMPGTDPKSVVAGLRDPYSGAVLRYSP